MKLKIYLIFQLFFVLISCSNQDEEIVPNENNSVNAMIYSGVHDPAQLIEINSQLVLFASAVEWYTYEFGINNWQSGGDDIYADGNPVWYSGSNLWAPTIFTNKHNNFRFTHSEVTN